MINWTARAKSEILETVGVGTDKTRETLLSSVSSVEVQLLSEKHVFLEPPADPNAWRELATAYNAHHFNCNNCIAAGRGSRYGLRCGVGAALWTSYQSN